MSPLGGAEHCARWEKLHGVEASPLVRRWLALLHVVAVRLPVPPTALTTAAVLAATAALVAPLPVAAGLVLLSAVLDGLDGAVAVVHDRVTRSGAVLDALGDRVCDGLFLVLLVQAGAPVWLGVVTAGGVLALELTRVVVGRPVTVTVGERPSRVLTTIAGVLTLATAGLALLAALTGAALVQLGRALRQARRGR